MRRTALIFCVSIFLLSAGLFPIHAQTASRAAVPTVRTQGLISDFLNWLSGILSEKKIPEKVEHVNCSTLPLGQATDCANSGQVKAQGLFDNIISRTGQDYGTAADSRLPITNDGRSDLQKWLDQTFAFNQGTEKASNYYKAVTPLGTAENLLSSNVSTSNESEAMARSEQLKKCANLPLGTGGDDCDANKLAKYLSPTPTATPTPTPTPTPADAVPPDIPPIDQSPPGSSVTYCPVGNGNCPDIPAQEAGKAGNPDFYKNNNCYWRKFMNAFSGNEVKARAASQICLKESGGNVINLNDHCLAKYPPNRRTRDYSVGLFQINMLAHCPGALRDDWAKDRSCTVINQAKLDECYARLTTFEGNVAEMKRISSNGTNWKPWSTAAPAYCGVDNSQMICVPPVQSPPQNPPPPPNNTYVYYSQKNYRTTPYGAGCTIYSSGCGPTTLAMILSTYLTTSWTPPVVAGSLLSSQSCQTSPNALYGALAKEGFRPGYKFVGKRFILTDADKASIKTNLANGAIILAGADMGWYERGCNCVKYGGHYFWIVDINTAGEIMVLDPWYGAGRPYPIAQNSINSYPVYYKHMIVAYPPGKQL